MADQWMEELAEALGVEALGRDETGQILKVSREVAHGVERMYAPLASYLLGAATERAVAGGSAREEAFAAAIERLRTAIPPAAEAAEPASDG
jgi:hypothetical protein